jgi:hypothetical protein
VENWEKKTRWMKSSWFKRLETSEFDDAPHARRDWLRLHTTDWDLRFFFVATSEPLPDSVSFELIGPGPLPSFISIEQI